MNLFIQKSTQSLRLRLQAWPSFKTVSPVTHFHQIHIYQYQSLRKKFSNHSSLFNMANSDTEEVSQKLANLGLTTPLASYPNCYPQVNPFDVYRAHITTILTEITGVDPAIIYQSLQWTQTLEKGDLVLPVPALRVKGKKPDELAKEWAEKVRFECAANPQPIQLTHSNSFQSHLYSRDRQSLVLISNSSSNRIHWQSS